MRRPPITDAIDRRPIASQTAAEEIVCSGFGFPELCFNGDQTFMRTNSFVFGTTAGGILAITAAAISISTVTHAATGPQIFQVASATSVMATRYYGFQAWATDPNHRPLVYSIKNKPAWATFNTQYGHLYGIPPVGAVGTYSNIVVSVSDGIAQASLPAFSIQVTSNGASGGGTPPVSGGSGAATLSWHPPTQNTNGSVITGLAGYRIKYGTSANSLTQTVQVTNPGLTSYMIQSLAPGTYYFGIAAYTSSGAQSALSSVVSKTIK
jgi:hypothetical protein